MPKIPARFTNEDAARKHLEKLQWIAQLEKLIKALTAAQSMLLSSVIRALLANDTVTENEISASLDLTYRAALDRKTPETPYLTGLIELLRRDLGLGEGTHPAAS